MNKMIEKTIQDRIDDIKFYIIAGWEKQKAIDFVKSQSCLGGQAWKKVLASV
jgi:hypothetical protein